MLRFRPPARGLGRVERSEGRPWGLPTTPVDDLSTLECSGPVPCMPRNCCCPDLKCVLLAGWVHTQAFQASGHPRLARRLQRGPL